MSLPAVIADRGISTEVYSAVKNSIFPGASDDSIAMAWDYCAARQLDIMLKPVHLVPMYIKDKNNGDKGAMRDVVMPGIGLYRIQADRAKNYAGMDAPKFGDDVTTTLNGVEVTFPEWCEVTVYKLIGDRLVGFTAREYWIENYATAGRDTIAPNAMWKKRPRGQITKCAEAQALRKAWPELGSQPTAEEMEGKILEEKDISPVSEPQPQAKSEQPAAAAKSESGDKKAKAPIDGESTQLIAENQLRMIRNKLNAKNIDESRFCAAFEIAALELLPFASINNALEWIQGE